MSTTAATALYLNPEWTAYSNITTVSQAAGFLASNGGGGTVISSLQDVPPDFHAPTFVAANSRVIPVSSLDAAIRIASTVASNTPVPTYLPTLQTLATATSSNSLRLQDPASIPSGLLAVGDRVQLVFQPRQDAPASAQVDLLLQLRVAARLPSPSGSNVLLEPLLQVRPAASALMPGSNYVIYGHQLADPERLGRIAYLRTSPTDRQTLVYKYDYDFNFAMYRLLYPDAVRMDRNAAYLDSISRVNRPDFRISKAADLLFFNNQFGLSVTSMLLTGGDLVIRDGGRLRWNDIMLTGVTNDHIRGVDQAAASNLLVTEFAAKAFAASGIDALLEQPAAFLNRVTFCNGFDCLAGGDGSATTPSTISCDLVLTGSNDSALSVLCPTTFMGPAAVKFDGLSVAFGGSTQVSFSNSVDFLQDLRVQADLRLAGELHASDFASFSGPVHCSSNLLVAGPALFQDNTLLHSNLSVGGSLSVTGNTSFSGSIQCLSNLDVVGNQSTFRSNLTVFGSLHCLGPGRFGEDLDIDSNLSIHGNMSVQDSSEVHGPIHCHAGLRVDCNATISSNINVTGTVRATRFAVVRRPRS